MKIIYNNIIPFKGFRAINLFGVVFARRGCILSGKTVRHEKIHTAQMREMAYVFFYLWYLVEWVIRLFCKGNAYRSISFEQEAYENDHDENYLNNRKRYAWISFIRFNSGAM